jgi:hypothetical protein
VVNAFFHGTLCVSLLSLRLCGFLFASPLHPEIRNNFRTQIPQKERKPPNLSRLSCFFRDFRVPGVSCPTPTSYIRDWLTARLTSTLSRFLCGILAQPVSLLFECSS